MEKQITTLTKSDCVLEAAAGTCACGRSVAPFAKSVIYLDATPKKRDYEHAVYQWVR
ncbi:hypothetical protein D3C73_1661120 [compost metagenome]